MAFDSSSLSDCSSFESWSESSSEERSSSEDETLDDDRNAETLKDLSRSIVSKSVKKENVHELPLPQRLKQQIFQNLLTDGLRQKKVGTPCKFDCLSFCSQTQKSKWNKIPHWSPLAELYFGVHLLYKERAFPSDAPWLKLPDRKWLLDNLRDYNDERIALLNTLRFHRRSGLGNVHVWLKRFLFYKSEYDWFFLVIPAGCMMNFANVAKQVDLVALPYSCVSDHRLTFKEAEMFRMKAHRRCMIAVVRDGKLFQELLKEQLDSRLIRRYDAFVCPRTTTYEYRCSKILNVTHLVKAIAYVSKPKREDSKRYEDEPLEFDGCAETHYFFSNPVVNHAEWWMLLMASFGASFETMVRHRSTSLSFGNRMQGHVEECVVRFDPPDLCIGDPILESELLDYLRSGKPFVFGFDNRIWSTFRMPAYKDFCVSHDEMNTLLHFDRKDVVDERGKKKKEIKKKYRRKESTDEENLSDCKDDT